MTLTSRSVAPLVASMILLGALGHGAPVRALGAASVHADTIAPIRSPEGEQARFRLADGYRMELVAAEPLVQDPVAVDFDADGRMYVVEMRAYMPNMQGTGEDRPIGRIVVVEDTDDDGRMDRSTVFMDSLVLPRAVKVLERGVLVGAPPNLWLVRDTTGDLQADTRELVRNDYGDPNGNPEHSANGLHWGIDNWIHNANYGGQFRVAPGGKLIHRPAATVGQWGVSSDEYGRIYRNSNEDPLRADIISSHYAVRNPNLPNPRGVYERLTPNVAVWPAHKTPAVNRGYRAGTLRADSTLAHYTSAGSPTAYVGDRLPSELRNNVFVTESAGNMVGRFIVREGADGSVTARTAYDRAEFITGADERFRPVNLANAPDGTLYVVDMYRGIVQHRAFITGYLEQKIIERGLAEGIGHGRIWRVVHSSTVRGERPRLSSKPSAELVPILAHPNGWWRMTAQRLLVERGDTSVAGALRTMARTHEDDRARLHALWTLDGIGQVEDDVLASAARDRAPAIRAAALRIAEPNVTMSMARDSSAVVRRQRAASLGALAREPRASALAGVIDADGKDPIVADLVAGALAGAEIDFLERLLSGPAREAQHGPVIRSLSRAIIRSRDGAAVQRLLVLTGPPVRPRWQRLAILEGIRAPTAPSASVTMLPGVPTALVSAMASRDTAVRARAILVAEVLSWPGRRATRPVPRALTAAEHKLSEAGQTQFVVSCASCHHVNGVGVTSLGKPLAGSKWVLGSPDALIRIVLHGKEGERLMPAVGARLTPEELAGVLTYIRRSWGNSAAPIEPALVVETRGSTVGRRRPWTEAELARVRR